MTTERALSDRSLSGQPPLASVLIIEDNETLLRMLERLLRSTGYDVTVASRGDAALKLLRDKNFEVVLSDINLPGAKGTRILKDCRSRWPHTEVILITGEPHLTSAVLCMKQGAFDYLSKPVKPAVVKKKVKAAAESSVRRREIIQTHTMPAVPDGISIVRSLGSGSTGLVLLVCRNGRHYAMKILRLDLDQPTRDATIKRFYREAAILGDIKHPHVVRVFDWGSTPDGQPFMLMEFVKGQTLDRVSSQRGLALTQKVTLLLQISSALKTVHTTGVVHRDIKPRNVLVTEDLQAKLTDFGLARFTDSKSSVTLPGSVVGSPAYMAPECFADSEPDQLSDIFSLGVLTYELMTGKSPFRGDSLEAIIRSVGNDEPVYPGEHVRDLPDDLSNLIMSMLEKDPKTRCQSVSLVVATLSSVLVNLFRH